jgi:hypothetical protein
LGCCPLASFLELALGVLDHKCLISSIKLLTVESEGTLSLLPYGELHKGNTLVGVRLCVLQNATLYDVPETLEELADRLHGVFLGHVGDIQLAVLNAIRRRARKTHLEALVSNLEPVRVFNGSHSTCLIRVLDEAIPKTLPTPLVPHHFGALDLTVRLKDAVKISIDHILR